MRLSHCAAACAALLASIAASSATAQTGRPTQGVITLQRATCTEWTYDPKTQRLVCKRGGGGGGGQVTGGGGCGGSSACGTNNRPGYRWEYDPEGRLVIPQASLEGLQLRDIPGVSRPGVVTQTLEGPVRERTK